MRLATQLFCTPLVGNVSTNAINENTFAGQLKIKPSRRVGRDGQRPTPRLQGFPPAPHPQRQAQGASRHSYRAPAADRATELVRRETRAWGEFLKDAQIKID